MSSIQNHRSHFARQPEIHAPRSTFNRSSGVKSAFDAGYIIPLKVEEIIPGDTISWKTSCFVRTLTNIAPYMDNLYLDFFAFFVPNRLVWPDWVKLMGERTDPDDDPNNYTVPQVPLTIIQNTSIWDYYGIYLNTLTPENVNALIPRGYNLIYNEWFRDQDIIDSVYCPKDAGPDIAANYVTLKRMKRHDYFTACRPWPQKGEDVLIPSVSMQNGGIAAKVFGDTQSAQLKPGPLGTQRDILFSPGGANDHLGYTGAITSANTVAYFPTSSDPGHTGLQVEDVSGLMGTINQLREAEAVQVLLERDARGGTRYIEMLLSQYGVINPDFRLQRPELIGQGQCRIQTTPVPQTSSTNEETPQGNLAGNSIGSMKEGFNFTHSFTEHGYLHIFVSARADLNYQQGLQKLWKRERRLDFYVPALANLGEQPVFNYEIYHQDSAVAPGWNTSAFGYNEAWADYRTGYNVVTGKFKNTYTPNLSQWHLAQYFTTPPTLNKNFLEENPPMERILATEPLGDSFFGDFWFDVKHTRVMPTYSIPGWSRNL